MALDISLIGAGNGTEFHLHGKKAGKQGVWLGQGQVEGIWDAPVSTEWTRARRERGGRYKGMEQPERDLVLGFHVTGDNPRQWIESDSEFRKAFTYGLDPYWDGDTLAQLVVEADNDRRTLDVQMAENPEFAPDLDPVDLGYGNVFYRLKVAQPMWQGKTTVTEWETSGRSGSGMIEVSNPSDVPMWQEWVLTPGTWTLPDHRFGGAPRKRVVLDSRTITLRPAPTGLRVSLDPMQRMFKDAAGTNVMGQVGGGFYMLHEIPPYTPRTELPISVTAAPSGGARAELHQPRLWSRPFGLY